MFKKLEVHKLSSNFREAVQIVERPLPEIGPNEVLVKNFYVGVNATDVNITAGRYFTDGKIPYDIGFESLGVIEKCGSNSTLKVGNAVVYLGHRAYTEYLVAIDEELTVVPEVHPKYVAVLACGLTAAIGLELHGNLKPGTKILVTAAAGGLGHLCVQIAKQKGSHVIGTCSTKAKADFLAGLGCDRVINYKEENMSEVLSSEYPDGIEVIWETIGGSVTSMLFNHLAAKGRMIVLGGTAGYKDKGFPQVEIPNLFQRLSLEAKTLNGFQVMRYSHLFPEYLPKLIDMVCRGALQGATDQGSSRHNGKFEGLKMVAEALEYLHSGANFGKVVVHL